MRIDWPVCTTPKIAASAFLSAVSLVAANKPCSCPWSYLARSRCSFVALVPRPFWLYSTAQRLSSWSIASYPGNFFLLIPSPFLLSPRLPPSSSQRFCFLRFPQMDLAFCNLWSLFSQLHSHSRLVRCLLEVTLPLKVWAACLFSFGRNSSSTAAAASTFLPSPLSFVPIFAALPNAFSHILSITLLLQVIDRYYDWTSSEKLCLDDACQGETEPKLSHFLTNLLLWVSV